MRRAWDAMMEKLPRGDKVMRARKILVADDDAHMTYMLSFKLQQIGVEVMIAGDGEEAYNLACQHLPDLVLTDYQMPGLSGMEMAIRLRGNPGTREIPVVMITARGHRVEKEELARTNIKHLIAKPFSSQDLLSKVSEILESCASAIEQAGSVSLKV